MDELKKLRDRIDWLDTQIASLLNERMRAADQIGRLKQNRQQAVSDRVREENVIKHVETVAQHPVLKAEIINVYSEIMRESRVAQHFLRVMELPFARIGIIGIGLIGGSICKAIKSKRPNVEIFALKDPNNDCLHAVEEGWIDQLYEDCAGLLKEVELLILASPISTIIPFSKQLSHVKNFNQPRIIIDVASVKAEIAIEFEKLCDENLEFIATHPMAGKEVTGFVHSQATLFVDRPWVITPHQKNRRENIDKVKNFVEFLGSHPVILDAATHDRQAALVSHLPAIIAKSYFDFVNHLDSSSTNIAGPGFQSFTRLAYSNSEMRSDILNSNRTEITTLFEQWLDYLKRYEEQHL